MNLVSKVIAITLLEKCLFLSNIKLLHLNLCQDIARHRFILKSNILAFLVNTLDEGIVRVIRQYNKAKSIWLFPNTLGNKNQASHYREYLNKVSIMLIGRKVNPHDFRHSLITEMGKEGAFIRDVMSITGHCDIGVVHAHYSHTTDDGRKKVLKMTEV